MRVTAWTWVHIKMNKSRRGFFCAKMLQVKPSFFSRFTQCCIVNLLAQIDVPPGLQPHIQSLVQMQDNTRFANDDRRSSDMSSVAMFVKWGDKTWRQFAKSFDRLALAIINRLVAC